MGGLLLDRGGVPMGLGGTGRKEHWAGSPSDLYIATLCGETTMRPMRLVETSEGNNRLPLYDFRSFRTFLQVCCRVWYRHRLVLPGALFTSHSRVVFTVDYLFTYVFFFG